MHSLKKIELADKEEWEKNAAKHTNDGPVRTFHSSTQIYAHLRRTFVYGNFNMLIFNKQISTARDLIFKFTYYSVVAAAAGIDIAIRLQLPDAWCFDTFDTVQYNRNFLFRFLFVCLSKCENKKLYSFFLHVFFHLFLRFAEKSRRLNDDDAFVALNVSNILHGMKWMLLVGARLCAMPFAKHRFN